MNSHGSPAPRAHRSAQWQYSPPSAPQVQSGKIVAGRPYDGGLSVLDPSSTRSPPSSIWTSRIFVVSPSPTRVEWVLSGETRPGSGVGNIARASVTGSTRVGTRAASSEKGLRGRGESTLSLLQ